MAVSAANPRNVLVYIVGRPNVFDPRIVDLRVRVEGIAGAAGNVVTSDAADGQQLSCNIL